MSSVAAVYSSVATTSAKSSATRDHVEAVVTPYLRKYHAHVVALSSSLHFLAEQDHLPVAMSAKDPKHVAILKLPTIAIKMRRLAPSVRI